MVDERKVQAILNWPPPSKVVELQSFLGLANYYRKFIQRYSKKVAPLTDLLKKDKKWCGQMHVKKLLRSLKLLC